ncbi:nucleotidyltransferase family protein [Methylomarinum sp. Ch1-1]|uniref:Nucleotidyltransferase family protein n=1 Tax=Methylomarinum roseum TaxID=3067653 RepID=A0AAU7NPI6_9GAMM|nr:nucleotidyltransferase family protein [Methylomarinum sp. Ch1-1]MDP4521223.1 nucleotidyltransferase family protein [Methylomarinum sp. Ch1-1]
MVNKSLNAQKLLLAALTRPESCGQLKPKEWEQLIRCARPAKLVAALGSKFAQTGLRQTMPRQALDNFYAAQKLVEYRQRLAMWELNRIAKALAGLDVNIVVLKGGAYQLLKLDMAEGRSVSDIDILVAKKDIERVEQCLTGQGWQTAKLDDYDQHYYRTWMHEIPPLRHRDRFIEVDIHHTILPLTSRLHPEPETLLKDAVEVAQCDFKVLAPCDMVLHSAVHLFYDAELNAGDFRDLVDLHELLTLFGGQIEGFWDKLIMRADELELERPLYYALYFSSKLLKTPIPVHLITRHKGRPAGIVRLLMEYLAPLALLPENPDYPSQKVAFARWLLYVRSHYLRMPLTLLLPHLMKKSKKRLKQRSIDNLTNQDQSDSA